MASESRTTHRHLIKGEERDMVQQITYLITAATGITGGAAIAALQANGQHHIRALAHREDERSEQLRQQGIEVVVGDLLDFHAVKAALQGMSRAYFCLPVAPGMAQATAQFAQAAKESGVEAIVNLSQKIARADARSHASFDHWISERVFDWSGIPVTHLRPTFFAQWLLYPGNRATIVEGGMINLPLGEGR